MTGTAASPEHAPHFHDEAAACAFVEAQSWPDGATCPRCGERRRVGRMRGRSTRTGTWKCYACRKPFTVRIGTPFEGSHVPLRLWLQAIFLGALGGDDGAARLQQVLGVTPKTARSLSARLRAARRAARLSDAQAGRAIPYDAHYKGMMEVLANNDGLMCGFKVHWPNETDSTYRRTEYGIDMVNCVLATQHNTLELMVGLYANDPGTFSPLVRKNALPVYTKLEGNDAALHWPGDGSEKQ